VRCSRSASACSSAARSASTAPGSPTAPARLGHRRSARGRAARWHAALRRHAALRQTAREKRRPSRSGRAAAGARGVAEGALGAHQQRRRAGEDPSRRRAAPRAGQRGRAVRRGNANARRGARHKSTRIHVHVMSLACASRGTAPLFSSEGVRGGVSTWYEGRDETCPVSTGGGTRLVRLVRGEDVRGGAGPDLLGALAEGGPLGAVRQELVVRLHALPRRASAPQRRRGAWGFRECNPGNGSLGWSNEVTN
jgi:hypothetical protein